MLFMNIQETLAKVSKHEFRQFRLLLSLWSVSLIDSKNFPRIESYPKYFLKNKSLFWIVISFENHKRNGNILDFVSYVVQIQDQFPLCFLD